MGQISTQISPYSLIPTPSTPAYTMASINSSAPQRILVGLAPSALFFSDSTFSPFAYLHNNTRADDIINFYLDPLAGPPSNNPFYSDKLTTTLLSNLKTGIYSLEMITIVRPQPGDYEFYYTQTGKTGVTTVSSWSKIYRII